MPDELHVRVHVDEGSLWATVEELPGVFATGDTFLELQENLEEGVSLYLAERGEETMPAHLGPLRIPPFTATTKLAVRSESQS